MIGQAELHIRYSFKHQLPDVPMTFDERRPRGPLSACDRFHTYQVSHSHTHTHTSNGLFLWLLLWIAAERVPEIHQNKAVTRPSMCIYQDIGISK